jgi:hypothetical protein
MAFEEFLKRSPFSELDFLHLIRKCLFKGDIWGFHIKPDVDIIQDVYIEEEEIQDVISATAENTIQDIIAGTFEVSNTNFGKMFSVIAMELKRLTDRAYDLLREFVPGLSNELLEEWLSITVADSTEIELIGDDIENKRALAQGKLYDEAKVTNAQFFIDYAETLGFTITVDGDANLNTPFICGYSRCDSNGDYPDLGHRCGGYGVFNIVEITVLSGTGNFDLMKRLFDKAKPAHVLIVYKATMSGDTGLTTTFTGDLQSV